MAAEQKAEGDGRAKPRGQENFPQMLWGRMVFLTVTVPLQAQKCVGKSFCCVRAHGARTH